MSVGLQLLFFDPGIFLNLANIAKFHRPVTPYVNHQPKNIKPAVAGFIMSAQQINYCLRRRAAAKPNKPRPNKAIEVGSGTVDGERTKLNSSFAKFLSPAVSA